MRLELVQNKKYKVFKRNTSQTIYIYTNHDFRKINIQSHETNNTIFHNMIITTIFYNITITTTHQLILIIQ